jgi:hypothetical protein
MKFALRPSAPRSTFAALAGAALVAACGANDAATGAALRSPGQHAADGVNHVWRVAK